jgi:hypothetical protein
VITLLGEQFFFEVLDTNRKLGRGEKRQETITIKDFNAKAVILLTVGFQDNCPFR